MKIIIKNLLNIPFFLFLYFVKLYSKFYRLLITRYEWKDFVEKAIHNEITKFNYENYNFKFYNPNSICNFRIKNFLTKEPETIEWLKSYKGNGILLDIGANIGMYSNFYAKVKNKNVYAFECSPFNLRALTRNIILNNNEKKIIIFPLALSGKNNVSYFNMNSLTEGGALSTLDEINKYKKFKYNFLINSFSLDYLYENRIIKNIPALIKIDVDGTEDLILKGAKKILRDKRCKSVLVEVDSKSTYKFEYIKKIMINSKFKIINDKKNTSLNELKNNKKFKYTYNQIWIKNN
jgi:FkbM family methyltransferase